MTTSPPEFDDGQDAEDAGEPVPDREPDDSALEGE